jgi:hypothetical protein
MPFPAPQLDVIPLRRAIDHYFELALYLLVLTGFGTLAGTGGLDLPAVVLVGVALVIRGYLLAKKNPFVIFPRLSSGNHPPGAVRPGGADVLVTA